MDVSVVVNFELRPTPEKKAMTMGAAVDTQIGVPGMARTMEATKTMMVATH